jgi:hypothetical protein
MVDIARAGRTVAPPLSLLVSRLAECVTAADEGKDRGVATVRTRACRPTIAS